ncbi:unnamed protein product [Cercospora beticola]|nr:unnamed protein product [Cercospora beticola]
MRTTFCFAIKERSPNSNDLAVQLDPPHIPSQSQVGGPNSEARTFLHSHRDVSIHMHPPTHYVVTSILRHAQTHLAPIVAILAPVNVVSRSITKQSVQQGHPNSLA